jgi:hypothetical protein
METIATILSALANIDSGSCTLALDEAVYPEAAVRALADTSDRSCRVDVERRDGLCLLHLAASDRHAARLQIGNALTQLLRQALQARAVP